MRTTLTIDDDEWMASDIDTAPIFVIPAKAGTQGRLRRTWPPWTPASAGATENSGRDSCVSANPLGSPGTRKESGG